MKRRIISPLFWAVARHRHAALRIFRCFLIPLCLLVTLNSQLSTCCAQGTAFTYQGRLSDGGNPANGNYDLRFTIFDAVTNGNAVSVALTNSATAVSKGLFTVILDFGPGIFTGASRWLDIGVRTNGSANAFTGLSPRQPVLPAPYVIFANTASNLSGSLPATQLTGFLPSAQLSGTYSGAVNFPNGANTFNGTFSGNGATVTNVNVVNLTGVLADSQLPGNTAFVNSNQTLIGSNLFTGFNVFNGPTNSFNGAFSGNGVNLTNLDGSQITIGTVADARLSSNVPLLNTNQVFTGSNVFRGPGLFTGTNFFAGVNLFTNRGNSFVGSFFGNGLVGWLPTNGTAVQAEVDHGYLLTGTQLTTVTLPPSPGVDDIVRISGAGAGGWKVAQNAGQAIFGNFSGFSSSSWTVSSAPNNLAWYGIASSADGTRMVAVFSAGGVYTSTDSGRTWGVADSTSRQWRSVASSADGSKLAGVVNNSFVFTSTNAGGTWVQRTTGLPGSGSPWSSIASSADGTKLVAVANGGGIYTSTDSGNTWAQRTSGLPGGGVAAWTSVASSSDGTKLAVAGGGAIYVSSSSGASWSGTSGGFGTSVASSADGTKLVGVVNGGGIYTSTDSGGSWTHQTTGLPASPAWTSVASSADGGKLAATVSGGGIYTSLNWGASWTQQLGEPNASWYAITSSGDGNKLAAAINSTISGGIYTMQASSQTVTTAGTTGGLTGGQGTAVELQYIGNNLFMPVSSAGNLWAF